MYKDKMEITLLLKNWKCFLAKKKKNGNQKWNSWI